MLTGLFRVGHSVLASFMILLGLLAGCAGDAGTPLRVGTNIWIGYEPLYLTRHLQYLDEDQVHLVEFTSNTDSIHAFRQGVLDAAALTLDEAFRLADQGVAFRIVLVMDISSGADVILANPAIRDVADLRGQRIGVESTAVGAYMLSRALEKSGLSLQDVELVPLEITEHAAAFAAGSVDALVTFEPVRSKLLRQGAQQLFASSEIPDEIVDVLIVRPEVLSEREDDVRELLRGWFRSLSYLDQHHDEALAAMEQRMGLDSVSIAASLDGVLFASIEKNREMLAGDNPLLVRNGRQLLAHMVKKRMIRQEFAIEPLLSVDLLQGL
ncbi:MAG: ABC transporter substrate-binding protein [Thermodesulfobacteriota bacterium]